MAVQLECMTGDGKSAIFTGTFFEDGRSITVCDTCLQDFMVTMLEVTTGLPVSALLAAATEQIISINETTDTEDPTLDGSESPESSGGDTIPGHDADADADEDARVGDADAAYDDGDESPVTTAN